MSTTTKRRLTLDASFFVCCGRGSRFTFEDDDENDDERDEQPPRGHECDVATPPTDTRPSGSDADDQELLSEVPVARDGAVPDHGAIVNELVPSTHSDASLVSPSPSSPPLAVEASRLAPMSLYRPAQSSYHVPPPPAYPFMTESISRRYAILSHRDNMREQRERLKMKAFDKPHATTATVN